MTRQAWIDLGMSVCVLAAMNGHAGAQTYPQKPVRLVVGVPPGGAGKHSAYIPTFGGTRSVTRALVRADGEFARSIADMQFTPQQRS